MSRELDNDGQPTIRRLNAARISDRGIDELLGICRGVLADGVVTDREASYLVGWMDGNREVAGQWPARDLYRRLKEMLVDRTLVPEEQGELLDTLLGITGEKGDLAERVAGFSATLPLCSPPPKVDFQGRLFCLTGKFAHGTRMQCVKEVVERGGDVQAEPTRKTSFLVVGAMGSRDWIHSSYGRKIQAAVELRENGLPLHIIAEEHWMAALRGE